MKSEHQKRVEQFMKLAHQTVPDKPTIPDSETCRLRAALVLEECLELVAALGCEILIEKTFPLNKSNHSIISVKEPDIIDVCDSVADVSVTNIGTLSSFGLPDEKLLEIVDENNLQKFGEGHSWNKFGKLIKPPNHPKPPIQEYIDSLS